MNSSVIDLTNDFDISPTFQVSEHAYCGNMIQTMRCQGKQMMKLSGCYASTQSNPTNSLTVPGSMEEQGDD
ncbi:hypothetical protein AMTR_s00022p00244100 [Amborella trichopoda]|uniref:Uncharacterized protein n=1 Tax=Amborella trichopoda TaxID=13333 RepID=W1PUM6_AMBTC|nr:hypothetical protein AMTR_s00022p00244100 [Amborella trichopoda]